MMNALWLSTLLLLTPQDNPGVALPPSADQHPVELKKTVESEPLRAAKKNESKKIVPRTDSSLPQAGTFIFWTLFVLILLAGVFFVLRKYVAKSKFLGDGVIRILARKPLTPKQQVFLVEVGPKVFLVGATKDNLNTLGEFAGPDDVANVKGMSPAYSDESVEGSFRKTLNEGIKEAETKPPSKESYNHVFDELKEIRKTVLSWKA